MKHSFIFGTVALLTLTAPALLQAAPAHALSFGFQNIAGGDAVGDAFNSDFLMDVTQQGSDVLFRIRNNAPANATRAIEEVYFDNRGGALTALLNPSNTNTGFANGGTVAFRPNVSNFPQGNNLIPGFTTNFGAQRIQGNGNANRINGQESLGVLFSYTGSFENLISQLNNGGLRVGIHVQSLDGTGGRSDSYVNNPTAIPTPALLPGLVGLGVAALRQRQQAKKAV